MTDWAAVHREDSDRIAALQRRVAELEGTVESLLEALARCQEPVVVEVVDARI